MAYRPGQFVIIFRYIAKELYVNLLAITSVIVAIFIINQFVHYVGHVAEGQYSMLSVIRLMVVLVPLIAGYLIPLGLYLSVMIVLGRWYIDQEMVVLQACGLGPRELLSKVLVFASLIAVVVAFLTMVVDPKVQRINNQVLLDIAEQSVISHILPQAFTSLGHGRTFYAAKVSRDHKKLTDVFLAERGGDGSWRITSSDRAHENEQASWPGRYLEFQSGGQFSVGSPKDDYHFGTFKQYGVRLDIPLKNISSWPEDISTAKLWSLYGSDPRVAAELQWRLGLPLSVFLLALLAVPLSHIKPRQGQYGRMFPAIMIYLVYANLLWVGKSWVGDGKIAPAIGLWWVHGLLLVCIIAVYLYQWGWGRLLLALKGIGCKQ